MSEKKTKFGECAYCSSPGVTKDHVPPKNIFAKGMPDPPWVPACESCNRGASKDDEYMQRLAMLYEAEACKDAQDVEKRFMRALQREEAKGLQADVFNSLTSLTPEQELASPDGINISLDGCRLTKIVEKIVRGWFFKLHGKRLPPDYKIMTYQPGKGTSAAVLLSNEELIQNVPGFYFGDHAFTFQVAFHPDDVFLSCWRMEFYRAFKVIAYTCRMGEDYFQVLDLRKPYTIPQDCEVAKP